MKENTYPYSEGVNPQVVRIKEVIVEIIEPRFTLTDWLDFLEEVRNGEF